jgi:hypothetical protein
LRFSFFISDSVMRNTLLPLLLCLGFVAVAVPARASDTDLGGGVLVGSGVDTGDGDNNPYQLQFGGFVELSINGYVMGFRGLRTLASESDCGPTGCHVVPDLRSMGGDFGFEWDLLMLHIGPRLGVGRVRVIDNDTHAPYFDPGGVLDVELGPFLAGVDIRYRFAVGQPDLGGLLAYARLGLRF